ncbi:MAG: GNAT family N-acetyltransferase, partial [Paracoccaceae bacterium]
MTPNIKVTLNAALSDIPAAQWDALACPESPATRPIDPFTTHRFLTALDRSHSTGKGTGWQTRPLTAHQDGHLIAATPLYVKSHSQGEYIFDHNWAQAYERSGGSYYPKLQIAVPFTPATGRRFLTAPGKQTEGRAALIAGAIQIAQTNQLSSLHITFCTEDEATDIAQTHGLLHRITQQFHWENRDYQTFDDFLASLSSRKRKTIRKERATAHAFGGQIEVLTGDQIQPKHWDAFWKFYQDTGARKWGTPYLTRAFFDEMHASMRDDILLV